MGLAIVESCLLGEDMDGRVDEEGAGDYVLGAWKTYGSALK